MVDDTGLQHRPRTTRKLRHRLVEGAEAAGAESPRFHEALEIAVAYLEMGADSVTCYRCGATMQRKGNGRYNCPECSINPLWQIVLGLDDPNLHQPIDPYRDDNDIHTTPNSQRYQWQP